MAKVLAAGIFIVKKDGSLLICHPTRHAADFWSIPKGKVEMGETVHNAAVRETYEETNINFNEIGSSNYSIHTLEPVNYGHKKKMICPFVYLELPDSTIDWDKIDIKCNSNVPIERGGFPEMDDYKWCSLDEAKKLLHETQVTCLDKIGDLIDKNKITITNSVQANDTVS